jgi:hypothetical protein
MSLEDKLNKCRNEIIKSPAIEFLFLELSDGYLCLDNDAAIYITENKLKKYQDYRLYDDELEKIENFVYANTFFGTIANGITYAFGAVVDVIMYPVNYIFPTSVSDLVVAIDKGDVEGVRKILKENPDLANECIEKNNEGKCISYPIFLAQQKQNADIYGLLFINTKSEYVKEKWRRKVTGYNDKPILEAFKNEIFRPIRK